MLISILSVLNKCQTLTEVADNVTPRAVAFQQESSLHAVNWKTKCFVLNTNYSNICYMWDKNEFEMPFILTFYNTLILSVVCFCHA